MARIRSIHPEQWTDDQFVTTSPLARLIALGVRNEADDNGIFEWNPIKLKMRLLPADNCDVGVLLSELEATNQIWRYEVGGRHYGMIRSFQRYQKPKKPTFYYPTPSVPLPNGYELSKLYFQSGSVPVPHQYGNSPSDGENRDRDRDRDRERNKTKTTTYSSPRSATGPAAPAGDDEDDNKDDNQADGQPIRNNGVPFKDIVDLYHDKLPELPACAKLTDTRKGYIRQRWQEDLPDIDAWGRYFDIVRKSDFLMGKLPGVNGKPPFRADLEWLTRPTNIVKVIEGKYHRG